MSRQNNIVPVDTYSSVRYLFEKKHEDDFATKMVKPIRELSSEMPLYKTPFPSFASLLCFVLRSPLRRPGQPRYFPAPRAIARGPSHFLRPRERHLISSVGVENASTRPAQRIPRASRPISSGRFLARRTSLRPRPCVRQCDRTSLRALAHTTNHPAIKIGLASQYFHISPR